MVLCRMLPIKESILCRRLVVCFDVVTLCKFKVLKGTTERLMYFGQLPLGIIAWEMED